MRRMTAWCVVMAAWLFCGVVEAGERRESGGGGPQELLLWNIEPSGDVTLKEANLLTTVIASEVGRRGWRVVTQESIERTLKLAEERQRCGDDVSCMAEIGNALGMREAIFGKVGTLGATWVLSLQRVDVARAKTKYLSSRMVKGEQIDVLLPELCGMVDELFPELPPLAVAKSRPAPQPAQPASPPPPTTGEVTLRCDPADAAVFVDGTRQSGCPKKLMLKPGRHTLRAERQGRHPVEETLTVTAGTSLSRTLTLTEIEPGALEVTITPSGAAVSIDGKAVKLKDGAAKVALRPGSYTVKGSAKDYTTATRTVRIEEGETAKLTLALERDYPMNPYKKYGYVAFFSGVGLAGLGVVGAVMAGSAAGDAKDSGQWSSEDASRAWAGVMYTGFILGAAAVTTGIVLWALSPGDRAWAEKKRVSMGAAPTPDGQGGVVMLGGRW